MPEDDLEGLDIEQVETELGGGKPSAPPEEATGEADADELRRLDTRIKQIDRELKEEYARYQRAYDAEVASSGDGMLATAQWQGFRKDKEAQLQKYLAQRETIRKNLKAEEAKTAAAAKYGFSSAGNKVLRTNPLTGEVSVAYEAPEKPDRIGASTAYSESQANARQEREQELQKWIREQDNLIRKGDIDARTAKSNLDSQMEFLKWALPKDMKYRPGFEPGGPIARSYAAAGQSYDPESPQNRIMGFVDPFQAAQQMGTPFGTQMQQAPPPAPPPAPPAAAPANPQQFAAAQQGPPAPAPVQQATAPAFAPAAPPPWFPPGPGEANPLPPWYDPNDPYGGMG